MSGLSFDSYDSNELYLHQRSPMQSIIIEEIPYIQTRDYDPLVTGTIITVSESDSIDFSLSESVRKYNVENYVIRGPEKRHIHLKCTYPISHGMFMQCTFATVAKQEYDDQSKWVIMESDSRFVIDIKKELTRITAKPSRYTRQTLLQPGQRVVMIIDVFIPSTVHGGFNQIARVVSNTFKVVCKINM